MAKRRKAAPKKVLEWTYKKVVGDTKAIVYTDEIDLDLRDNQVAEIWHINSNMHLYDPAAAGADDYSFASGYVSTDPDAQAAPDINSTPEDAEIFYFQETSFIGVASATPASFQTQKTNEVQQWAAPDGKPILVGTNLGVVFEWNTTADLFTKASWGVRIFFTRRTASGLDLAHILLKRR
jgi:hypothetical protein